jgi:hypothetical protein
MRDEDWDDDVDEDISDDAYIECPHCGQTMLEDAEYCPSCDRWISDEDSPRPSQRLWIVVGIALCLAIALTWILKGF